MKKNFRKGKYLISTDRSRLNIKVIQDFISKSYWAKGRPLKITRLTIKNSLCFGLYFLNKQIGFARVVTDSSTFAYLADVFILEEYRGKGLSKWLMEVILDYEELKTVKSWKLATSDAHGLYEKFGFKIIEEPWKFMEMSRNDS